MWVFGYGSLMWDGWETAHGCTRRERASLDGFRRDFNKASVRNWGSQENRGPTLGLSLDAAAECVGLAFELPESERDRVLVVLGDREGASFTLEEKEVDLQSGIRVRALVPVNDTAKTTYIGNSSVEVRARMATIACGSKGACVDYVKNIRAKLQELGIEDSGVEEFWSAVSKP
jgi:cation transport protein ChaC